VNNLHTTTISNVLDWPSGYKAVIFVTSPFIVLMAAVNTLPEE
jgi:hypothetical protein